MNNFDRQIVSEESLKQHYHHQLQEANRRRLLREIRKNSRKYIYLENPPHTKLDRIRLHLPHKSHFTTKPIQTVPQRSKLT